ncbi:MAG: hypothetical protein KDK90_27085, partial [Leptospiraceae bacterium]|nr:hypothetical protein [Leptospiraceae bacterium]
MDKNGILEITKAYPKNLSELYKKITTAKSAGDEHKLLLDFAEMFSAYLVGFLLGEYRKSKEIVEKIETQLYINKKAKLSFGIYISYLRELSQSLSDSLLKEKLNKKKNYENSAKLKLNFEEFKKIHKEGLPEKFTEEVGKRLKGRNPSKVNLVESFDLLTQIRNRYAHAADYNWPLGDEYYNWLNPLLSETISELVTDFELLRSYKIVRLQEIGQDEKKYIFQNLESTGEEILEVSVSQDMESQLIENKCYFLDENNNLLMRYFQNELPLPDRNVAEKLEGEEKYKLIEPVLIPTIEERLEDDDMIDNEEYAQLMDIAINAGVEEDKLKKLIYKVAKDKGIVGDPLLMEKAIILNLVEKFEVKKKYYTSNEYNETQLRIEFLDLFFEALGWDVFNKKRTNEVTRELTVRTQAGRATRVDYAFYLGNKEKFFVEAKDATVNLKSDPKPALQLRRYSWNKGLPIGVVSNFREFAIYDCRQQPDEEKDSAKTGLLFYCTNEEYNEKWEEILKLLSKKAVQDGSIDQFSDKHKVTLQTVDQAFLADMEKWRELLANDLAANNSDLLEDLGGLNYAVQMTIDRLVFLRIAEDRESEPTEQLARISKESDIYASLVKLYHQADDKYNSGFFHFKEEKGRENPDDFTINLKISNECLKEIIDNLYSRPYDFS